MNKHTPKPQLFHSRLNFISLARNAVDITYQRFGRLFVLGPVDRAPDRQLLWLCQCDCGDKPTIRGRDLRSGHTQSCGCLNADTRTVTKRTHGLSDHPLYGIWCHIIGRCTNPNDRAYPSYGGRGISIYDGWRHDFPAFCNYVSALPHCHEVGYSIDRINNEHGYAPGNVRWVQSREQNRNRRDNRLLTHNGKTQVISQWAIDTGIDRRTICKRLNLGWTVNRALTQPVRRKLR